MSGIWHYVDAKGERQEETLTDEQCAADATLLKEFTTLEGDFGKGVEVHTSKEHAELVKFALASVTKLPTHRAAHWTSELARIGIKPATTKTFPKAATAPAPAATEPTKTVP